MARTTQQVYEHHVKALLGNDLQALMEDYAEDSVLVTLDGVFPGPEAILAFFTASLAAMKDVTMETTGVRVQGDCVLCAWRAQFDGGSVPHGVDTFVIRDDRIRLQTGWFPVVPA